jgi:hypothetical protein
MLEIAASAEILELRLNHRTQVTRRVVPKLDDATRLPVEHEDHSATNLSGWHCHIANPEITEV